MAATWDCSHCHTVNRSASARCMVCDAPSSSAAAPPRPDEPGPLHTEPPRHPGSGTAPALEPLFVRPPIPTPPPVVRPPPRIPTWGPRARSIATGWSLGLGHIGLFVLAAFIVLIRYSFGAGLLRWGWQPSVWATTESWYHYPVIDGAGVAASKLPGGIGLAKYEILALVCLIVRLFRFIPGWLSLLASLVAASFGVLLVVAQIPLLASYWPLTAGLVIVSFIIVAKTRRLSG